MSQWRFIGDSPRTFPDLSLEVAPGDTIDADENPDPHYFEESTPKAAKAAKAT